MRSLHSGLLRTLLGCVLVVFFAVGVPAIAGAATSTFGFLPGAEGFDGQLVNADGSPVTQAGSHPYALSFDVNFIPPANGQVFPSARDLTVNLPAGVVANPLATGTRCTEAQLESDSASFYTPDAGCPDSSAVGTVTLNAGFDSRNGGLIVTSPLYNMVTPAGVPAEFAFDALGLNLYVHLFGGVRTGGDYGLSSTSSDIDAKLTVLSIQTTLWGDPSDPSHDALRGRCAFENTEHGAGVTCPVGRSETPFLTLPSACSGPLTMGVSADSWLEPGVFVQDSFQTHDQDGSPVGVTGCERLDFSPSASAQPDTTLAGSPAGLGFDMHIPQSQGVSTLAEANLKNAVVKLPVGMTVNPSAANGLVGCSPAQVDLSGAEPAACPDASKIGTVEVVSPLADHPLPGSVFLADQGQNPFGSLLAMYIAVDDPATGVVIKVAGHIEADPVTGQLTATFDDLPQLPFEDLKLQLFGGPRGVLVNPGCGSYAVNTALTPWSSPNPAEPSGGFQVNLGCGAAGFAPGFSAGTVSNQAGAFSPFTLTLSRQDGEQAVGGLSVRTPPGFSAILKGVERCGEPQAQQGTCGAGSLIGHATVTAGVGPDPVSTVGQVFLTGPYDGAPFGLSVVVPAVAGPFNLGTVVVRSRVEVDPNTAQVSIVSDAFPTILQGIPLDIRKVNVSIDRAGFAFNPTSCEPLAVTGTVSSAQGAQAPVSSRFQAAGCAGLAFHPVFKVSTQAKTSKGLGASLDVEYTPGVGQANTAKVAVSLPRALPARLTTIQQACTEAAFNKNPASCPAASVIGTATATTPILATPAVGPVYLVSHGGAAFPNVVAILQSEGVTVQLTGSINIKGGVTSAAFDTVPDVPITMFEMSLPEGPHSGLAANLPAGAKGSMCAQKLTMPTTLTAQNGVQLKQSTKITVTGCPKTPKKKAKAHKKKSKHKKPVPGRKK
jgi:hypothetical protein